MNAKDAIRTQLQGTLHVLTMYLGDLADADLMVRPVPNANHIAWQLGHLINTECRMAASLPGAPYPQLPAGFEKLHSAENAKSDQGFLSKSEYLRLFSATREATIAGLAKMPDADLDKPTDGPMAQWAPTLGALLVLNANHTMMHAGQFTVVRRKLGKPVLF